VGHILFFPIKIKSAEGKEKETISLAPLGMVKNNFKFSLWEWLYNHIP
jgi:hypothetical protein